MAPSSAAGVAASVRMPKGKAIRDVQDDFTHTGNQSAGQFEWRWSSLYLQSQKHAIK